MKGALRLRLPAGQAGSGSDSGYIRSLSEAEMTITKKNKMKKIFIFSMGILFILLVSSCRKKQKKESHYTVYQAGQSGAGMAMQTGNRTNMMNITLSHREIMLANIKTDTARIGSFSNQIILTGTTIFDPQETSTISAWVSGQIKKLYVRTPGEYVNKGEKLYDLYSPDLLSAEKDYLLAIKQKSLFNKTNVDIAVTIKAMKLKLLRYGLTEAQIQSLLKREHTNGTVTIYSKTAGYVIGKMKEEGDYVNEGEAVFQLAKNNTLWVQAQLYDTEISLLSQHPKIWVKTDALPGKKLQGHIVYNNPVMNNNSRVLLLNISIDNPGGNLQPGMLAYVYLQTNNAKPVVMIPKSAIIYDIHQDYIWMQMPQPDSTSDQSIFMRMPVQVGRDNQTQIEILDGVQPGEIIVSSGAYLLNSEYILQHGNNSMAGMKM